MYHMTDDLISCPEVEGSARWERGSRTPPFGIPLPSLWHRKWVILKKVPDMFVVGKKQVFFVVY